MTNEQMAILKARAIAIKMQEAVKILEELNKKIDLMRDWRSKKSLNFTKEQESEYNELIRKDRELSKKIRELTE